ncbi:MAG: hypothetical protein IM620_15845 [Cytophagales bacterium]|nr:hypothetical protein [Cytophagales bacterium]
MRKYIRDGEVAVLISPDFGAGWSTWNPRHPQMLFDPVIVELLLNAKEGEEAFVAGQIEAHVETNYPDASFISALQQLKVRWVPVGTEFIVNEYDGNEWIVFKDHMAWIKA